MNSKYVKWAVLVCVIGIIFSIFVSNNNNLVKKGENVDSKWAQVDNLLQRRFDLIPNLVGSVKGYAGHEQKVISDISNARAKLGGAKTPNDKANANDELQGALNRLLIIQENYPNLKADKQFSSLMAELKGTENRLTVARRDYNESVKEYNLYIKQFPTNLISRFNGFEPREYFKGQEESKTAPTVSF